MNSSGLILALVAVLAFGLLGAWLIRKQRAADVAAWKKKQDSLYEDAIALLPPEEREDIQKDILSDFGAPKKEPIQTPQRNAGSRPSSDDSPASETPSSLGPRG